MKRFFWFVAAVLLFGAWSSAALAQDIVIHSGNVTKIDKAKGTIEIINVKGVKESFVITDKDILSSPVWKKRLNVGDGVDIKTSDKTVVTVLRRNLPVTIKGSPPF